jgi:hypothetical protein
VGCAGAKHYPTSVYISPLAEWTEFDVSEHTFDEFVSLIFALEPSADWNKQKPWYFSLEVIYDPQKICAYYLQLFRSLPFFWNDFRKPRLR